jgi:glycosyltransferase involved in cell wall biosynthesis
MKTIAKKILRRLGIKVTRPPRPPATRFVELPAPRQPARGTVLIAYVVDPFRLPEGRELPSGHTHFIEARLMVEVFHDLGYAVDVVDYRDTSFVPRKSYDILVSSRVCLERYAKLLGPACLKIFHVTVSHWLCNNAAATARCLDVQRRRGVSLASYKLIDENWALEHADFAIYSTGNDWVPDSYAYAGKPFARVPLCTHTVYPPPEGKDFDGVRRTFLWLGSHGFVHKGLDLVLEAFAAMPDCRLIVCGPIHDEPAFERAFERELYQTSNIETVGWVDIASDQFREIVARCVGLVYPSCAEGASGNVLTCMQAGLIPVISYPSCVDMSTGNGVQIEALDVDSVQQAVRTLAAMPAGELSALAMRAWSFARDHHTHQRFSEEYRKAVETALATVPSATAR